MAAFQGYLLKLGGENGVVFPNEFIEFESYKATPNSRLDLDSKRDTTGKLHRKVLSHQATHLKFTLRETNLAEHNTILALIHNAMSDTDERKVVVQYWDDEWSRYKTETFYFPDMEFTIKAISGNDIYYGTLELELIEY